MSEQQALPTCSWNHITKYQKQQKYSNIIKYQNTNCCLSQRFNLCAQVGSHSQHFLLTLSFSPSAHKKGTTCCAELCPCACACAYSSSISAHSQLCRHLSSISITKSMPPTGTNSRCRCCCCCRFFLSFVVFALCCTQATTDDADADADADSLSHVSLRCCDWLCHGRCRCHCLRRCHCHFSSCCCTFLTLFLFFLALLP